MGGEGARKKILIFLNILQFTQKWIGVQGCSHNCCLIYLWRVTASSSIVSWMNYTLKNLKIPERCAISRKDHGKSREKNEDSWLVNLFLLRVCCTKEMNSLLPFPMRMASANSYVNTSLTVLFLGKDYTAWLCIWFSSAQSKDFTAAEKW